MASPLPLVVIDVQPSGLESFRGTHLVRNLVAEIKSRLQADGQVYLVHIDEELSGDDSLSLEDFWLSNGLSDDELAQCTFVVKRYAELRGWMDIGIPEDEIVATLRELHVRDIWDSRHLPDERLAELSEEGSETCNPLFRSEHLERSPMASMASMDICGGGRDECLREVELWLESRDIAYNRIEHLVY